jgi:DNA helicase II / ATP-dependent DNA helicase PcrA
MNHTPAQLKAINSDSKNILVIAGAGSGKTATTVRRIAKLIGEGVSPSSILSLTFTRKAANELRERLGRIVGASAAKHVWCGTFHAISYRILMQWGSKIGYQTNGGRAITVITPEESEILLKEIIKSYNFTGTQKAVQEARSILAHDGTEPEDLNIKRIIGEYHNRLKECNAVDFDQLLLEVQKLFAVCPSALEFYQTKFNHIFVDEYQDTDKVQYSLHEILKPKHLFCVGDSDQAIYGWRGANIDIILNFEKDHPGAEVIRLEECFRCADSIVASANSLIKCNQNRIDKKLVGATGTEGIVELELSSSPEYIANYLAEYLAFESPEEIAVIARTHRSLEQIEAACKELNLDVLRVGKTAQTIETEPSYKFLLACVRLAMNPRDNFAFLTANQIGFKHDLKMIWSTANVNGCSWYETVMDLQGIDPECSIHEFYSDVCSLVKLEPSQAVSDFLLEKWEVTTVEAWLQEVQIKDNHSDLERRKADTITLITAHAAKGLEWNNVLVVDFDEGSFPSKMALRAGNLEEERRLAYVAFTRARSRLLVFKNQDKIVSRFAAEAGITFSFQASVAA